VTIYTSQAAAQGFATVHYACADCSAVTLDATNNGTPVETGSPPDSTDDYGAVFELAPPGLAAPLAVTISGNGVVDIDAQVLTPDRDTDGVVPAR
jgi:hypothetical protein